MSIFQKPLRSFLAAFDSGRCPICREDLREGEEVVYVDDELCHVDCARDEGEDVVSR